MRDHRYDEERRRSQPRVLALDGSVVHVPRCFERDGYSTYHRFQGREGSRPIGLLSCLVDVETREVVAYKWGERRNERAHAAELFRRVDPGSLIIMDRGYFSEHLLCTADSLGIKVLFRVRSNANGQIRNFTSQRFVAGSRRRRRCTDVEIGGVHARLFQYRAQGTTFTCLTTSRLALQHLAELYRKRWSVETFFRSWKGVLRFKHRVSHDTTSPLVFKHALDCSMILYELTLPIAPLRPARTRNGVRSGPAGNGITYVPARRDAVLFILLGPVELLCNNATTSFSTVVTTQQFLAS
jgi:hypothetical protein